MNWVAAVMSLHGTESHLQNYLKEVEKKFGREGSNLLTMTLNGYSAVVNDLFEKMKKGMSHGPALLKDYSPWLDAFQASNHHEALEIPGQLAGGHLLHLMLCGCLSRSV